MDLKLNVLSLMGVYGVCFLAWLFSIDRTRIPFGTIKWGIGTQFVIVFLCAVIPGVLRLFENLVHIPASTYILFIAEQDSISDFTVSLLGNSIFRGSTLTIFFSILFIYLTKTHIYQRILTGVKKFSLNTFKVDSDEFISSISSSILSYEAFFLSPTLYSLNKSRLFTILSILAATPSSLFLFKEYSLIKSVSQSFLGHLYLGSLLSVFSTLVLSKIIVPEESKTHEPESASINEFDLHRAVETTIKFLIGLYLGGILFQILILFSENLLGSLVFSGDLRIIPEDGWYVVFVKIVKSGFTEAFTRLTPKNILAFILLPLCFLSGISSEVLEIWKVSLLFSNSFLGQAYDLGLPVLLKDGTLSMRASFLSVYFLVAGNSLIKIGMVWGAVFAILPEKMKELSPLFFRLILVSILSPFLSISILGIFELGQLIF